MHPYSAISLCGFMFIAYVSSSGTNVFYNVSAVHDVSYGEELGRYDVRNMLDCTRLCSRTSSCRSVMFAVAQKLCVTNRRVLDHAIAVPCVPGDGCPQDWGRKYAEKHMKTTMRQPCLYDYECVDPMSECRPDICTCVPGYSYNRTSYSCVTECSHYGTAFQLKLGKRLADNNEEELEAISRDVCKEMCMLATSHVCRSVEFYPNKTGINCFLSSITAVTRPDVYVDDSRCELFTRDCL